MAQLQTDKYKLTRNPWINFSYEFREKNPDFRGQVVFKRGADVWNKLTPEQKEPYVLQARNVPRKKLKKSQWTRRKHHRESTQPAPEAAPATDVGSQLGSTATPVPNGDDQIGFQLLPALPPPPPPTPRPESAPADSNQSGMMTNGGGSSPSGPPPDLPQNRRENRNNNNSNNNNNNRAIEVNPYGHPSRRFRPRVYDDNNPNDQDSANLSNVSGRHRSGTTREGTIENPTRTDANTFQGRCQPSFKTIKEQIKEEIAQTSARNVTPAVILSGQNEYEPSITSITSGGSPQNQENLKPVVTRHVSEDDDDDDYGDSTVSDYEDYSDYTDDGDTEYDTEYDTDY